MVATIIAIVFIKSGSIAENVAEMRTHGAEIVTEMRTRGAENVTEMRACGAELVEVIRRSVETGMIAQYIEDRIDEASIIYTVKESIHMGDMNIITQKETNRKGVTVKYAKLMMQESFATQEGCVEAAEEIVAKGLISDMTVMEVAKEIYTHAYVYYHFEKLPKFIRSSAFAKKVYRSAANGIDLEDGGDTAFRRMCYEAIWLMK